MNESGPALVTELVGLIEAGRTVEAIKRLREATGASLRECKDWVDERAYRLAGCPARCTGRPCPYCGKPLATDQARQCFECGMDWHDPDNLVQHAVIRKPARRSEGRIACDDFPIYTISVICVGSHPAKVFALLREVLQVSPAVAKAMLREPRIEVARGPRMLVEQVAQRFEWVGAEVEWKADSMN